MKRIFSVLFALVLVVSFSLVAAVPVAAGGNGAQAGHFSASWTYDQSYDGWGPALYYGEAVDVHYEATNTWTWVERPNSVQESLVQNGTAEIYSIATGELLDELPFHVVEVFKDDGKDVVEKQGNWWTVSQTNPYSDDLEFYHYVWKITGVYRFEVWNKNGERIFRWRSPDKGPGWDVEYTW